MTSEETFQVGYSLAQHGTFFGLSYLRHMELFMFCLYLYPYVSECHSELIKKQMHLFKLGCFVCLELRSHKRNDSILNSGNQDPHRSAFQIWQIVVGGNADSILSNRCIFFASDRSAGIRFFDDGKDDLNQPVAIMIQ